MTNTGEIGLAESKLCVGCGACENICDADAIQLTPDENGFFRATVADDKCVECGKCANICPQKYSFRDNTDEPDCYAFMAEDEIRKVSSSGGAFTVAANEIFKRGGIVAGVAWDKDFGVEFRKTDNPDDLHLLRRSKYMQPKIGSIYREIKQSLDEGRHVLFSGCPCHVAGLYAFLGMDYERLYTIDLICSNLPSQSFFRKYLSDNYDISDIESFDFRIKDTGWHPYQNSITDSETGRTVLTDSDIPYMKTYLKFLMANDACVSCKYRSYKRQGDITMADFWLIDQYNGALNDGLGTSHIFVNSQKGAALYEAMCKGAKLSVKVPKDCGQKIDTPKKENPSRRRFFDLIKRMLFNKASDYAMNKKYDIGIVMPFNNSNYGSSLVGYALYRLVKDMGYEVLQITPPLDSNYVVSRKLKKTSFLFRELPYPAYDTLDIFPNIREGVYQYRELNNYCDRFLLGSDQVLIPDLLRRMNYYTSMNFVDSNKKITSYAPSFGTDNFNASDAETAELGYFLKRFDMFSVREKSGVRLCKDVFNIVADCVLDPTLLLDRAYYDKLAQSGRSFGSSYIMAYILDPNQKWKRRTINKLTASTGTNAIFFPNGLEPESLNKKWCVKAEENITTEDWLAGIANSEFVITDSFHGVCFSIIYKKPFAVVSTETRSLARFDTILELLGLSGRIVFSYGEFEEKFNELISPIDYERVYSVLDIERARSMEYLKKAIAPLNIVKGYTDYDAAMSVAARKLNEIDKSLAKLKKRAVPHYLIDKKGLEWLKSGEVVVWGAGRYGKAVLSVLEDMGITPVLADSNASLHELATHKIIYDVYRPEAIKSFPLETTRVLVAVKDDYWSILDTLEAWGYDHKGLDIFAKLDLTDYANA